MSIKKPILLLSTVLFSLLLLSGTASARQPSAEIGTGFTYQGRLDNEGAAADGRFDFEFRLYDDSTGDVLLGSNSVSDVPVAEGLFTVQLDFGAVFNGSMHFLEISVRPSGSSEAYTILSPRQALTAAPSAIYAASAPWSGLTGIPEGFADGTDDGANISNVIIVAKSGGDFTSIQAALDSIGDASAENSYLVYVAPGVYSEQVTMKEYVDIEGAGELMTKITHTNSDSSHFYATLLGASNAELRFLTVENTSSTIWAKAILNRNASPRLTNVTANASAGGSTYKYGVLNEDAASPIMTNVTISASGGVSNRGVENNNAHPTMTNVTVNVFGTHTNFGVYNIDSSSTMANVKIGASRGTNNYGIYIKSEPGTHTVLVNNSKVTASNYTIYYDSGQVRIISSQLSGGRVSNGSGSTVTCIGVYDENYVSPGYNICP